MPVYTYTQLKADVGGRIHNKMGLLKNSRDTLNRGVRKLAKHNLRSTKRSANIAPDLFNDIYQYAAPSDLNGMGIVGIQPQDMLRSKDQQWNLTTDEEFDARKQYEKNLLAISDRDFVRKLLVSAEVDDRGLVLANFDSLTGDGGTWAAFGDGENLSVDTYNFIRGSASIKWDIDAAGGTTAGLTNTGLNTFDLTEYASNGSVFVWVWITSATNLTNFILKIGNSATNNYQITVTTTNEGAAFATGWNLLRFDLSGKTTNGTVTDTTANFVQLYMNKAAAKVSETDYRFDALLLKRGKIHNVIYYSKFLWQTSAGVYLENSTADTDLLNVDTDEYDLIVEQCVEEAALEAREYQDAKIAKANLRADLKEYRKRNPSEALPIEHSYYDF